MLNCSSSTTASEERGPTPICSTVACPSPTTRPVAGVVIGAKISQRRGKDLSAQHRLRTDVSFQGVDRLRELRRGVVRAAQVVQQLGTARDVGRVLGQRLQLVDRV